MNRWPPGSWQAAAAIRPTHVTGTPIRTMSSLIYRENRTNFPDHVFAPPNATKSLGQTVNNLLSPRAFVPTSPDGTPGRIMPRLHKIRPSNTRPNHASAVWPDTHFQTAASPLTDGAPASANDDTPASFATLAAATRRKKEEK